MWSVLKNKYKTTDAWPPQFLIDVKAEKASRVYFHGNNWWQNSGCDKISMSHLECTV